MINKLIIISLLAFIISGCSSPKYLPDAEDVDVNQYGSYIDIVCKTVDDIDGELISIDSNKIIVLPESPKKSSKGAVIVQMKDVKEFSLQYANKPHYGWTIPVFTLVCIGHGAFGLITGPVNFVATILVTISGETDFDYSSKDMNFSFVQMFARFPQGLPPNIALDSIR